MRFLQNHTGVDMRRDEIYVREVSAGGYEVTVGGTRRWKVPAADVPADIRDAVPPGGAVEFTASVGPSSDGDGPCVAAWSLGRAVSERGGALTCVLTDYYSGGHRPYQNMMHSREDTFLFQATPLEAVLAASGAVDGDEVEIVVRRTGARPFGARGYRLTKPHTYVRDPVQTEAELEDLAAGAVSRAESLSGVGSAKAAAAHGEVSRLEEAIADILGPDTERGRAARDGAVATAARAGDSIRVRHLVARYAAEDANILDRLARIAELASFVVEATPAG